MYAIYHIHPVFLNLVVQITFMKLRHYGVLHCVPLFPFHAFSGSSVVEDEVPHTYTRTHARARTKAPCKIVFLWSASKMMEH
jgi:hypothetical protein